MRSQIVAGLALVSWYAAAAVRAETTISLGSAEYRTVELAVDVSPEQWADRAGIEASEQIPLAGGGSILRFEMDEGVWRARRQALCTEPGVVACDMDLCQSYYAPAVEEDAAVPQTPLADSPEHEQGSDGLDVSEGGEVAEATEIAGKVQIGDARAVSRTRLLLVPRAPELAALFADRPATTELSDALPGLQSCAAASDSTWEFANAAGSGEFAFTLPQEGGIDRGCWELVAASQCESRVRPLSDLLPEFEPVRVLAIVDLAQRPAGVDPPLVDALTTATGLRFLDSTTLQSINKSIVRFELVDPAQNAIAAVALLNAQPGIERAQHEYRHRTMTTFDDPYAWMNYAVRQSGAERFHSTVLGQDVEVAVIDTGVDTSHPELQQRVAVNLDVTGFGESGDRHGTAVAGIIAAEANNAVGAYGIAPAASIFAIKACQPEQKNAVQGRCWSSTLAKALDAAIERGSRIINLSLSGPPDPLVQELIEAALAQSRLVVAAAGNGGPDARPSFPASMPGVLAVTAVDARERLYAQATRGDFVDLAAPGVEVPVPVPGATYPGQLSGTSMATASASAVAALLVSAQPDVASDRMRAALESSAVLPKRDNSAQLVGRGRIDACGAARALEQNVAGCDETAGIEAAGIETAEIPSREERQ